MTLKHVGHSDTSLAAAEAIAPDANRLRVEVYKLLLTHRWGLTDHEMQTLLNMAGSTQRPRRVELVEKRLVVDSGIRRKTPSGRDAVVWIIRPVPVVDPGDANPFEVVE